MIYTFEIRLNGAGSWTQFYPLYDDALSIDYKKEDGDIFFRRMLDGDLVFVGDEYTTISGYENDDEINIKIEQDGVLWWEGFFGKFDGEWDEDACTFTVNPTVNDEYTCLKHKGDDEVNILNVPSASNVDIDFTYYEYVTCGPGTVTLQTTDTAGGVNRYGYDLSGANYTFPDEAVTDKLWGSDITNDVYDEGASGIDVDEEYPGGADSDHAKNINNLSNLPDQGRVAGSKDWGFVVYETTIVSQDGTNGNPNSERDFTITTVWFREVIWTIDVDGNSTPPNSNYDGQTGAGFYEWEDVVDSMIVDGVKLHKWARRPEESTGGSPAKWTAVHNGDSTFPKTWTYDLTTLEDFSNEVEQCRPIKDVVDYMLNTLSCGITYRSTFFDNDVLPPEAPSDIDAIITAASGDNYVTETASKLNHLMIAQKSDVIACVSSPGAGCSSSEDAIKGMLTFNDFMDILYKMFQVYWYIDSEDYFRIEHERFFSKELGDIDLTTQLNKYNNELWEKNTKKYKYTISDLYGKERWEFMEQNYPDFLGETIDYDDILSNTRIEQKVKDYNIGTVTTDMMMIHHVERTGYLPGPISTDGFVILQCSYDGSYTCDNEVGALSGNNFPNNHLSVANLQDKYWRWNRIQEEGTLNKVDVEFNAAATPEGSYRRTKEQIELQFETCTDDFDEMKLIKTSLGNGEIASASYNLSNGIMTVILRYLP